MTTLPTPDLDKERILTAMIDTTEIRQKTPMTERYVASVLRRTGEVGLYEEENRIAYFWRMFELRFRPRVGGGAEGLFSKEGYNSETLRDRILDLISYAEDEFKLREAAEFKLARAMEFIDECLDYLPSTLLAKRPR